MSVAASVNLPHAKPHEPAAPVPAEEATTEVRASRLRGSGDAPAASKPPEQQADAILARCEHSLAEASDSVDAAKTGKPTREQIQAAAARVAEAKQAFAVMRAEISESLSTWKQELAQELQDGLRDLEARAEPGKA